MRYIRLFDKFTEAMILPSPPFDEVSLFEITNILIKDYGIKMDVRPRAANNKKERLQWNYDSNI